MTRPFSLRVPASLAAAVDARAAQLGEDRAEYILSLVERDLAAEEPPREHRFASEDLIGSMRTGLKSGANATVRRLARQCFREEDR